jgi:hypothetical protein
MHVRVSGEVAAIINQLREAVERERLPRPVRLEVAGAVRRAIIPKLRPGRKNPNIESAWPDYQRGVRGLKLYRRHIPDHGRMNQYRRIAEENRLLDGLRKRARRMQDQSRGEQITQNAPKALAEAPEAGH